MVVKQGVLTTNFTLGLTKTGGTLNNYLAANATFSPSHPAPGAPPTLDHWMWPATVDWTNNVVTNAKVTP
jgi:hypothetical protein